MTAPSPPAPNQSLGLNVKDFSEALTAAGKNVELGKYRITSLLGHGEYDITYLAQNIETGQEVVIKENMPRYLAHRYKNTLAIVPGYDAEADFKRSTERFLHRAKQLMQSNHPNVVKVQDTFAALGTAYYVMPRIGGNKLSQAAPAPEEITEAWLAPILWQLLDALQYLHDQYILHQNIKPSNILMSEGSLPMLIDFGINLTTSPSIISPISPIEQLSRYHKIGPWTDIYALGVTCYHLITGYLPPICIKRIEADIYEKEDEYRPLAQQAELFGRFSRNFLQAIDKALAVWPKDRWQSAQEWLGSLFDSISAAPGVDVNKATKNGETPLYRAAKNGHTEVVRLLLAVPGIDVNKADDYGCTPLDAAKTEEIKSLLRAAGEKPKDELTKNAKGKPLFVKLLIAATPLILLGGGWYAYHAAYNTQQISRRQAIESLTAREITGSEYDNKLIDAVYEGNAEPVQLLITAGADVNVEDEEGITPLLVAAFFGQTEVVRLLLAAPDIDINKADEDGITPLRVAAFFGQTEVVRLLLAAPDIDINKADKDGETPLYRAALNGHAEVVRLLLAAPGIDVNKANEEGETPLDMAKTEEIQNLLRAAGGKAGEELGLR